MNQEDDVKPSTSKDGRRASDSGYVIRNRRGKKRGIAYGKKSNEPQNVGVIQTTLSEVSSESGEKRDIVLIGQSVDDSENVLVEGSYVMSEPFMITRDGQMISPPEIEEPITPPVTVKIKECSKNKEESPSENITSLPQRKLEQLPKTAETYELEKFSKNVLLIFNQENVNGYRQRYGTEQDVTELERTFSNFGFDVIKRHDFTKKEIEKELKEFCSQDFTDYGCVGVVVLTHGTYNGLIRAKDDQYSELLILDYLKGDKQSTLITKPKLVIIQACRGGEDIKAVNVSATTQAKTRKDFDEEIEPYTLPAEADMLILHSSYIGKPSHRHELDGSWFIQSLCKKINELWATEDLESIMTAVKRDVAIEHYHEEYNKRTRQLEINKQMPVTTSTLIRKLYLKSSRDKPSVPLPQPRVESTNFPDNSVLDNTVPSTPILIQFGPCSCFLEHYEYMMQCLK
ncbi:unnamed protein product [Diatraea saccharalis]|uniref:Caspase-4 n=1 Tax=Diatraea saccharalis TaxID=40085 RepID=A0A9N9WHB3_9NEOP|nr:unnamed protein product [Diatraea saccharalis]